MTNLIKYITSFILILAGIAILVVHNSNNQNVDALSLIDDTENSPIFPDTINVPVDLDRFQDRISTLKAENPEQAKILPIVIVTTKTCPPCNDNIVEYAELLQEHDLFFEPTLVFVDEEKEVVDRFLLVNDLKIPFVLTSSKMNESIFKLSEHLIFINMDEQKVFYNFRIPTVTINFSIKEQQLNEVAGIWHRVF